MARTRKQTLDNLRAHGIEPEEAFLDDFTKFGKVTQDRLIETFKQFPNIESRYKFIKTAINKSKILNCGYGKGYSVLEVLKNMNLILSKKKIILVKINKIKIYYLEHKLKKYVYTSFGVMKSRPGLIIELSDDNGNIGLGEIWCNFPSNSASYKFQLFKDIFANKLLKANSIKNTLEVWTQVSKFDISSDIEEKNNFFKLISKINLNKNNIYGIGAPSRGAILANYIAIVLLQLSLYM